MTVIAVSRFSNDLILGDDLLLGEECHENEDVFGTEGFH
jgi:hypothetical protein